MKAPLPNLWLKFCLSITCFLPLLATAQTETDALMMSKKQLCVAGTIGYNSWENYWEGTFKRDNANLGRVSTKSAMLMLNYGFKNNLNVLASLPYLKTQANAGTLAGMHGFQDVGIFVKWKPLNWQVSQQLISIYAVGGISAPTNQYNIDFLPMSIGLGSRVLSGRLIADLQQNKYFLTVSGAYLNRGNVTLDRPAYYTDHQINSNEVDMPDAGNVQVRTGYRNRRLIMEAFLDNMTTLGGFDIRKNDMPFVSNKMNSTKVGLEGKYYLAKIPALGFHGNAWHTLSGRNVGQATGFMAGVDYIFDFSHKIATK